MLKVKDLLENNEHVNEPDMPVLPEPIQTEKYIPDEGSPSQFLQLENFEGLVLIHVESLLLEPFSV